MRWNYHYEIIFCTPVTRLLYSLYPVFKVSDPLSPVSCISYPLRPASKISDPLSLISNFRPLRGEQHLWAGQKEFFCLRKVFSPSIFHEKKDLAVILFHPKNCLPRHSSGSNKYGLWFRLSQKQPSNHTKRLIWLCAMMSSKLDSISAHKTFFIER